MSYILDALKKSDQQRQRGITPTLRSAPAIEAPPAKKANWVALALAIALLLAVAFIGWLRPWHQAADEAPAPTSERDSGGTIAASEADAPDAATPVATPPMTAATAEPAAPAPVTAPALPTSPALPSLTLPMPAPPVPKPPATPAPSTVISAPPAADAAPAQPSLPLLSELSPVLRQDMPAITVSLHAYAVKPERRLVSINNQLLREGDTVAPDLRLEQITTDGMVLNFRGTRFRHGVQ